MLALAGDADAAAEAEHDPRARDRARARCSGPRSRTAIRSRPTTRSTLAELRDARAGLRLEGATSTAPASPARSTDVDRRPAELPDRASTQLAARHAARRPGRPTCAGTCCDAYAPLPVARPSSTRSFAFYGTTLRGVTEQRAALEARRRRGRRRARRGARQALRRRSTSRRERKARMDALVDNLLAALRAAHRHARLDEPGDQDSRRRPSWPSSTPKIGYPDKWRDYSRARRSTHGDLRRQRRCARARSSTSARRRASSASRSTATSGA